MYMPVYPHGRGQGFLRTLSPCFYETGPSLSWNSEVWLAFNPGDSPVCLPCAGITGSPHHIWLFKCGFWGSKSSPYIGTGIILLTEPDGY